MAFPFLSGLQIHIQRDIRGGWKCAYSSFQAKRKGDVTDEKVTNVNPLHCMKMILHWLINWSAHYKALLKMCLQAFIWILFSLKDDDTNYQMDLIAGLANMWARNDSIPEVDKLKAKFIVGRIIPTIDTTTAMAIGLVCLEVYKVILGHKVEKYCNTFANLTLPLFSMAEPVPSKLTKHGNLSWCVRDRWVIIENLTIQDLLDWFQAKDLYVYNVTCMVTLIITTYFLNIDKYVSFWGYPKSVFTLLGEL